MFFYLPVKIVWDKLENLNSFVPNGSVCLVTSPNFPYQYGYIEKFKNIFAHRKLEIYDKIKPNPTVEDVKKGISFLKEIKPYIVVGFGGGSVMDAAKVMAAVWNTDIDVEDLFYGNANISKKGSFFIAIPTTTGTGSEVTQYAVFIDKDDKHGISSDFLFPDIAYIDVEPALHQSTSLLIDSTIDALTHAIEGYLSIRNEGLFNDMAFYVMKTIISVLPEEVSMKTKSGIKQLQSVATMAGMIISQRGTILLHAAGYPLTVKYDIPHGRANLLLLPAFLKVMKEKGIDISPVLSSMDMEEPKDFYGFMEDLDVSMDLRDYGVKKTDLKEFSYEVMKKRNLQITPGIFTREDIEYMYNIAYEGL